MSQRMRIVWLLSLLFFVTGCSGYRVACRPSPGDNCELESGETVRINLSDGRRIEGEVTSATGREIVLSDEANREQRAFQYTEIQSVEKPTSYTKHRTVGLIVALGVIVIGGAIILDNATSPSVKPIEYDIWY